MLNCNKGEDDVGRLVTDRSKVAGSATGAGLPSGSTCKDPRPPLVLSFSIPWVLSGDFFAIRVTVECFRGGFFRRKNPVVGGATTTPLLSAECQNQKKSALKPCGTRV